MALGPASGSGLLRSDRGKVQISRVVEKTGRQSSMSNVGNGIGIVVRDHLLCRRNLE